MARDDDRAAYERASDFMTGAGFRRLGGDLARAAEARAEATTEDKHDG